MLNSGLDRVHVDRRHHLFLLLKLAYLVLIITTPQRCDTAVVAAAGVSKRRHRVLVRFIDVRI